MTTHAINRLNQRYKNKKKEQAVHEAYKCESFKEERGRQFKCYQGYIFVFEEYTLITLYSNRRKRIKH